MEWLLTMCTAGWIICGQIIEKDYPTETACYRALKDIRENAEAGDFKYIICAPKQRDRQL